jgi:hypothetical protein
MENFWSSLSKWFNEKANSPLYWTYFFFFIIWNWKIFQIIFLEEASLFNTPRVEYIENYYYWHPTGQIALDIAVAFLPRSIPPAILTFLSIKYLPWIHSWAFDIYTDNLLARKESYRQKELDSDNRMAKLKRREASVKTRISKQEEVINAVKSEEDKVVEEISKITDRSLLTGFQGLVRVIYSEGGALAVNDFETLRRSLPGSHSEVLSFAGVRDLIVTTERSYGQSKIGHIELTEKGKLFSKVLSDNNIV